MSQHGWIEAVDPRSGKTYFANTVTKETQWEKPAVLQQESSPFGQGFGTETRDEGSDDDLPSNWEVMHDPTTGKPFYVDHERKITQWTRPEPVPKEPATFDYSPATPAYMATPHSMPQQPSPSTVRSYFQEASYFQPSVSESATDVDFSDGLPKIDFTVKTVADKFRSECPSCDALFTLSKRRHHCRLCGDIFCDACSSHRVSLPLEGPEFEKPVRICDLCNKDVEHGNFFSMRRYMAPLTLFDPEDENEENNDLSVASKRNVNAALDSLTSDLDQFIQSAEGLENKVTIPPEILVLNIVKHLKHQATSDRAVRALSSLLSFSSMSGKQEFGRAVYKCTELNALNAILNILERSGSERRTLFVQEKAAQVLFYLTDSSLMASLPSHDQDGDIEPLDIQRCLRNMLDHSSSTKNPNLQRWSVATIRNLIVEDERRTTLAINDVAAALASGQQPAPSTYKSCLDELVATGGIMILCSLIAEKDSDTRAHAISGLGATLAATRSIDNANAALSDLSGGSFGKETNHDAQVIRAILAGGGVSSSVAQLLLSADNNIAQMGCNFINTLVIKLLEDSAGASGLPKQYDCSNDSTIYGSYREAALGVATEGCLPALLSIVHESGPRGRPLELRCTAAQSLAAVIVAVVEMGKSWSLDVDGTSSRHAPAPLVQARSILRDERVAAIFLDVAKSPSYQSLGSNRDTVGSKIRESAGIVLGALATFLPDVPKQLWNGDTLSFLLSTIDDHTMIAASSVRGNKAPKFLGFLEAAAASLYQLWQEKLSAPSELLDTLLIVLDSGFVSFLLRMLSTKIEWDSSNKAVGAMKVHAVACSMVSCLFGLAHADTTDIGMQRLVGACNDTYATRKSGRGQSLFEAVLSSLQNCLVHAHKSLLEGMSHEAYYAQSLTELVTAAVVATGSICGSSVLPWEMSSNRPGTSIATPDQAKESSKQFQSTWNAVCKVACDIILRSTRSGSVILSTLLVGAFGEEAGKAAIRLSLAIAENGGSEPRLKLAQGGVLVPAADLLKTSLGAGNMSEFSSALSILRHCGPHVSVNARGGGIQPVRDGVRTATKILWLPVNASASVHEIARLESLKQECILTIESLSKNSALWNVIAKDSLLSMIRYLESSLQQGISVNGTKTRASALQAILQIVQVPSSAAYAADMGLLAVLTTLLRDVCSASSELDYSYALVAMRVLHFALSSDQARGKPGVANLDLLHSVFYLLGATATQSDASSADAEEIVFLGMEVVHFSISQIESLGGTPFVLQSEAPAKFLKSLAAAESFLKSLCATCFEIGLKELEMATDGSDLPSDCLSTDTRSLSLSKRSCAGFPSMETAALSLFFHASVYASAVENESSAAFWHVAVSGWKSLQQKRYHWNLSFAVLFARLITERHPAFVPANEETAREHEGLRHPLVLYKLLEAIKEIMEMALSGNDTEADETCLSILMNFNLPSVLLSASADEALADLSHHMIRLIVEADVANLEAQFLSSEESTKSLLDLLTTQFKPQDGSDPDTGNLEVFSRLLLALLRNGSLDTAVEIESTRLKVLQSITLACAIDWSTKEGPEISYSDLSNELTRCLIEFSSVEHAEQEGALHLRSEDALVIAEGLGKKICKTILTRFLERARLQECNMGEEMDVLDIPEVELLCALAEHPDAMFQLRSTGGYHALSQVAGEGKVEAIDAIVRSVSSDSTLIVDADTHIGLLSLFLPGHESKLQKNPSLESSTFSLLATLLGHPSMESKMLASTPGFKESLDRALFLVTGEAEDGNGEDPSSAVETDAQDEANDETETDAPQETAVSNSKTSQPPRNLLLAAEKFLSSAISTEEIRGTLLVNTKFVQTILASASTKDQGDKQLVGIETIIKLVPYINSETALGAEEVADVLCEVLNSPRRLLEANQLVLCEKSAQGLLLLYQTLEDAQKEKALTSSVLAFERVLKCRSLSQCTQDSSDRRSAGELALALSCIFSGSVGHLKSMELLLEKALSSLASLVQWNFDPATKLAPDEAVNWKATAAQGLQVLSCLVSTPCLQKTDTISRLKANTWMVAAPQKSPRRAMALYTALGHATKQDQAISILMARSILKALESKS